MNNNATLLVLGNGFDLKCDLKSSFSDFFETKLNETRIAANTDSILYSQTCSNIWYLFLYLSFYDNNYYDSESKLVFERFTKDSLQWMDVEKLIKKVVATNKKDDNWMNSHLPFNNCCDYLIYLFNNRNKSIVYGETNQALSIKKHFRNNINALDDKTIQEYLYEELLSFEEDFKNYLIRNITETKEYKQKVFSLIKQLVGQEPFSILTFNYTSVSELELHFNNLKGHYNVHGELSNKIVIGFDSSDIDPTFYDSIMLSKAWQKMNVTTTKYRLPRKGSINKICFYGHSLGPQDYSYFHAIFDHFDIYNSDIKLVFYYSEYKETPEDNLKVRTDYITSIFKLLNEYAVKSGNEEKVKTILSRLQLENRLLIEIIPKQ